MNEDEQIDDSSTAAWGKTSTLHKKGHIRWTLDKTQMDWSVSLLQQMLLSFKMILGDKNWPKFRLVHSLKWHVCLAVRQMSSQHENKTLDSSRERVCQWQKTEALNESQWNTDNPFKVDSILNTDKLRWHYTPELTMIKLKPTHLTTCVAPVFYNTQFGGDTQWNVE